MLIDIEGIDCAGKTTLINRLKNHYTDGNVIFTREPGGTSLGLQLREILLHLSIDSNAEFLLFMADRIQHQQEVILPHKEKIVVCDRGFLSTYVYQVLGKGQKEVLLYNLYQTFDLAYPDLILFLDCDPSLSIERMKARGKLSKFDSLCEEDCNKLYRNYLIAGDRLSDKFLIIKIDASKAEENVFQQVQFLMDSVIRDASAVRRCKC